MQTAKVNQGKDITGSYLISLLNNNKVNSLRVLILKIKQPKPVSPKQIHSYIFQRSRQFFCKPFPVFVHSAGIRP